MLLNLVSASNAEDRAVLWGFLSRYAPGATPASNPELDRLVGYAIRFFHDFVKPGKVFRAPTETERAALAALDAALGALPAEPDGDAIQAAVYDVGRSHFPDTKKLGPDGRPGVSQEFFASLYQVLIGPGARAPNSGPSWRSTALRRPVPSSARPWPAPWPPRITELKTGGAWLPYPGKCRHRRRLPRDPGLHACRNLVEYRRPGSSGAGSAWGTSTMKNSLSPKWSAHSSRSSSASDRWWPAAWRRPAARSGRHRAVLGLAVTAAAYAIGPVSEAIFNPAVTVGAFLAGRMSVADVIPYIIAQLVGATLASVVLLLAVSGKAGGYDVATLGFGQNGWDPVKGFSMTSTFHDRGGGNLRVRHGDPRRHHPKHTTILAGLVIGLTLAILHMAFIPVSGNSLNPARASARPCSPAPVRSATLALHRRPADRRCARRHRLAHRPARPTDRQPGSGGGRSDLPPLPGSGRPDDGAEPGASTRPERACYASV